MHKVTTDRFIEMLRSSGSHKFRSTLARYDLEMLLYGLECHVQEGDLSLSGDWRPEQANLIVTGAVNCTGLVNLAPTSAVEEGGSLWIFGNLECTHFANHERKAVFVDGNMRVTGLAVNSFEDAALIVIGSFDAEYFHGNDIWVEAGGAISMAFGKGYGLPLGYTDARRQAVLPRHDVKASLGRLDSLEKRVERVLLRRLTGK